MSEDYPRDLVGYGASPPHPQWPGSRVSPCSLSLTTKRAVRTVSTATRRVKRFCPTSSAPSLADSVT